MTKSVIPTLGYGLLLRRPSSFVIYFVAVCNALKKPTIMGWRNVGKNRIPIVQNYLNFNIHQDQYTWT